MKKKLFIHVLLIFIGMFVLSFFLIHTMVIDSIKGRILVVEDLQESSVDCILVLGAGVSVSGRPSSMLEDRLLRGVELYHKKVAPRLLVSGDHGRVHYDEVNVMKKFVVQGGVPSSHVFMDHAGFSTYDSVYRAKAIFGVQKMVVVSQKYHLYRALYIADQLGIEAYGVTANQRVYLGQVTREIRELLARMKDYVKVQRGLKPIYLGEEIPIGGNGDLTND